MVVVGSVRPLSHGSQFPSNPWSKSTHTVSPLDERGVGICLGGSCGQTTPFLENQVSTIAKLLFVRFFQGSLGRTGVAAGRKKLNSEFGLFGLSLPVS